MKNIYLPNIAVIKDIYPETDDIKTFTLEFKEDEVRKSFNYKAGQFIEVSVFGTGEAPFSICSTPSRKGFLEISIRDVGAVSNALHKLQKGDEVGIRGPLGNGFTYDGLKTKEILVISGGIGLATLRSLLNYIADNRKDFNKVTLCYGARCPKELVFKNDLKQWADSCEINVLLTVDHAFEENWQGNIGIVTDLLSKIDINAENAVSFSCGPPFMISSVNEKLITMGFKEENIFFSMERYIKCGVGKCGHCNIGPKYTCLDGPVFSYQDMKGHEHLYI